MSHNLGLFLFFNNPTRMFRPNCGLRSNLPQQFKIPLAGHARGVHVRLDVRDRHLAGTRLDDERALDARFRHHNMIALLSGDREAFALKNLNQRLIPNGDKLGHSLLVRLA